MKKNSVKSIFSLTNYLLKKSQKKAAKLVFRQKKREEKLSQVKEGK